MRKMIVAGNWKMNKTLQEGIELASEVNDFFDKEVQLKYLETLGYNIINVNE